MKKVWEESPTGLKVNAEFLKGKAENREFLGNRDTVLPPLTKAFREGWERIFGKKDEMPDLQRD